jgi:hypothetical protein
MKQKFVKKLSRQTLETLFSASEAPSAYIGIVSPLNREGQLVLVVKMKFKSTGKKKKSISCC